MHLLPLLMNFLTGNVSNLALLSCHSVCFYLSQATFLFSLIRYTPLKYNNVYEYPTWGIAVGWLMALSSMICIPLYVVIILLKTKGSLKEVKQNRQKGFESATHIV